VGKDGLNLAEHWARGGPKTLNAMACRGFPNLFFLNGPQGVRHVPTACVAPRNTQRVYCCMHVHCTVYVQIDRATELPALGLTMQSYQP
jgi:hypothetical protein